MLSILRSFALNLEAELGKIFQNFGSVPELTQPYIGFSVYRVWNLCWKEWLHSEKEVTIIFRHVLLRKSGLKFFMLCIWDMLVKMFSLPAGTCVDLCLPVICGKTKQVFFFSSYGSSAYTNQYKISGGLYIYIFWLTCTLF